MTGHRPAPQWAGERAVDYALTHLLGKEYELGGELPKLDCSGLVKLAWRAATDGQVDLYHQANTQFHLTARIFPTTARHIGNLRRGDLVFYEYEHQSGSAGVFGHVAMFVGWLNGHRWVVQATDYGQLSEVIPMDLYAPHQAFGRVKFGDWNSTRPARAQYHGYGLNRARFAHFL